MKKNVFIFIFFCTLSLHGISQNLSPNIISTQGGVDQTGSIVLEWTLGENFIETVDYSNMIFTQGFHQPFLNYGNGLNQSSIPLSEIDIKIGPNPVFSYLNILMDAKNNFELDIRLYDIYGKFIKQQTTFTDYHETSFNLIDLQAGIYLLEISDMEGLIVESVKILKIN
jgi:hypothetical protein